MVDRKTYSRSRQKAFLNRVVDEELYKPDWPYTARGGDLGIGDLLMRGSPGGQAVPRNRLADLLEPAHRGTPESAANESAPERRAAPRPGLMTRLWRGLASLLPGVWS